MLVVIYGVFSRPCAGRFLGDSESVSETADKSNDVLIADRFRASLDERIPELDTPGAVAYAASDLVRPEQAVYLLVLRPGYPFREAIYKKLFGARRKEVICPVAEGMVTIAGGEMAGERPAIVLNYPAGGHVFPKGFIAAPMTERELRARVIPQLVEVLDGLHGMGITHRGVTLNNVFCQADGRLMLGECFTSPPGFVLAHVQEPLDSAQAAPEARGEGSPAHDMFALGILIMSLYVGSDIGAARGSPQRGEFDDVMRARLRYGSFQALAAPYEVTGLMGDLLRGLLDDRTESRWDVDDVQRWLGGVAPRMKAGDERWVLVRPIAFEEKIIQDRRELAFALSRNVPAAAKLIRNGKFLHWIQNTLVEALEPQWLEKFLDTRPAAVVGETGQLADEWAVARVCAVLDPEGPIRFKGQAYTVDGLGTALAVQFARGETETLDILRLLLTGDPFRIFLEMLKERNSKLELYYKRLFDSSRYIENSALGSGFERVLYLLNPQITCRSPRLAAYHADTPAHLLRALEARARDDTFGGGLMDPHIAAFISCQSRDLEESVKGLDQSKLNATAYATASLRLLGALQKNSRLRALPHLARYLSEPLRKCLPDLHGRTFRRQVTARLEALIEQGDLTRLANDFNVMGIRFQDDRNFRTAQYQFATLKRECRKLERPMSPGDPAARQLGYLGSACFSVVVLLATGIYLMLHSAHRWI